MKIPPSKKAIEQTNARPLDAERCIVSLLRAVGDDPAVINSDVQYVD